MSRIKLALVAVAVAGLLTGFLAPWLGLETQQGSIWGAATAVVLAALVLQILATLSRGEVGLDIVAALSMSAALAFGETLAGVVVALMYAGGQLLEDFAQARARSEMKALLGRAPTRALRYLDGRLVEVPIDAIRAGDRILVRQGDVVPADGTVADGNALLDQAVITGESVPVRRHEGEPVLSGSTSLDMAFDMVATRSAAESTYSGIVKLVRAAQEAKAPMVRLADRFAMWFLLLTVLLAGAAWLASGDRLRALAVLVVATPGPLILAVPVAIVSGISRAARRGVLLKGGPVLETLARVSVLVIDKTGTLTLGQAKLVRSETRPAWKEDVLLRYAASLEQASNHVIAQSIVAAAQAKGLALARPERVREDGGRGLEGHVEGRHVVVGGPDYVRHILKRKRLARPAIRAGELVAAVAIGRKLAGFLILADTVREDAGTALARLRAAGIGRVVLASGDHADVVEQIGEAVGADAHRGELEPKDKIAIVQRERRRGVVLMAGDGINDAPALAAADIGMAMGARGAAASAEAADAVLLVDDLERIAEAVEVAQRSRAIALQSVYAGLGLSIAAMAVAAWGYLPPVQGALLQEVIDVAVIANALRALR
jgi:heavy metal translocating P-type ATPase